MVEVGVVEEVVMVVEVVGAVASSWKATPGKAGASWRVFRPLSFCRMVWEGERGEVMVGLVVGREEHVPFTSDNNCMSGVCGRIGFSISLPLTPPASTPPLLLSSRAEDVNKELVEEIEFAELVRVFSENKSKTVLRFVGLLERVAEGWGGILSKDTVVPVSSSMRMVFLLGPLPTVQYFTCFLWDFFEAVGGYEFNDFQTKEKKERK